MKLIKKISMMSKRTNNQDTRLKNKAKALIDMIADAPITKKSFKMCSELESEFPDSHLAKVCK